MTRPREPNPQVDGPGKNGRAVTACAFPEAAAEQVSSGSRLSQALCSKDGADRAHPPVGYADLQR